MQWHAAEGYEWIKWEDYVPKQEEPFWNEENYGREARAKPGAVKHEREIENLFG